jgi:alpha-amylase
MVQARKERAYGVQRDWFDDRNIIGWTREGLADRPNSGCAVLMSDGPGRSKWMEVGGVHAGRVFVDLLEHCPGEVLINADGWGEFCCSGGSVSVWAPAASSARSDPPGV